MRPRPKLAGEGAIQVGVWGNRCGGLQWWHVYSLIQAAKGQQGWREGHDGTGGQRRWAAVFGQDSIV